MRVTESTFLTVHSLCDITLHDFRMIASSTLVNYVHYVYSKPTIVDAKCSELNICDE